MKKFKGTIYQAINIQNGKSYIGKTIQNFEDYKQSHIDNAINKIDLKNNSKGKYFYNALRKHGVASFKWIILGEIFSESKEELKKLLNESEQEAIWLFRTFGSDGENFDHIYGYNKTKGGDGGDCISQLNMESYNSFIFKKSKSLTENWANNLDRRINQSKRMSGENHFLYNKKHLQSSISLMSLNAHMRGKTWLEIRGYKRDCNKGKDNPAYVHFSDEEIYDIIKLYTVDKVTITAIEKKYLRHNKTIKRVLKENDINIRTKKESNNLKKKWNKNNPAKNSVKLKLNQLDIEYFLFLYFEGNLFNQCCIKYNKKYKTFYGRNIFILLLEVLELPLNIRRKENLIIFKEFILNNSILDIIEKFKLFILNNFI